MKRYVLIAVLFLIPLTLHAQSGTIGANVFGFQCGNSTNGCIPGGGGVFVWPTTSVVPHCLRLWDAGVQWAAINTAASTYNWGNLDQWLDLIASKAATPACVIYTIGWTPPYIAANMTGCITKGCPAPPSDLTGSGSPTFNAFITALVNHCSGAGNCVKTLIKYWELWNEADNGNCAGTCRWTGTVAQLYNMMAPGVTIIQANVSSPTILSPPIANVTGYSAWACSWIAQETANGIISNIYAIHGYLNGVTPETKLATLQLQNAPNATDGATCSGSGWTPLPVWVTEVNYTDVSDPPAYTCPTTGSPYTANDCAGQVVRFQLLVNAIGYVGLDWYSWLFGVGDVTQYETAYYYMVQYLTGGNLTSACSVSGGIYSCPFTEANSTVALWVWQPCTLGGGYSACSAGTSYTVPAGYNDYRDIAGGRTTVTPGQSITVGVQPIMLEQVTPAPVAPSRGIFASLLGQP